jgi:nucleoside-diphosphate-sugar epimerase
MILVTGATGLVGGHLVWHLLQKNEQVYAIKRNSSNLQPLRTIFSFYTNEPDIYLSRINWKKADVLSPESLISAFSGIKTVYHCAAIVSLGNGSENLIETNVQGTENVVKAALESCIDKLCFVSSIAACGHAEKNELIDENTHFSNLESRSAYSQSKYLSEQEVWKGIEAGLKAVIVNPGVILGVSGTNTGSSELFARVKKGLPFYTNGGSGYVDVQDVVQLMIRLTESTTTNERFVLISENCSNKEILSWMADGFGKARPVLGISRPILYFVGLLMEFAGKIFGFNPTLDRGMALSATNRSFYSAKKVINLLQYEFKPIRKCIDEVCNFEKKQK